MIEKQLEQLCNMFFEIAQLPLVICQEDGQSLYWVPHIDEPDEPPDANRGLIEKYLHLSTGQNVPYVEIVDPTFFFAVIKFKGGDYLVIGPAAPLKYDERTLLSLASARNVPAEKQKLYCERIKQVPEYSFRHFLTLVSLLNYSFNSTLVSPDDLLLQRPSISLHTEENLAHALFQARESQVTHTPASFERYLLQAISDGNVAKLKQAFLQPMSGAVGRMSGDPLQQEKFTFISFATLVTRAAIAGGLSQELAFSLSDIYCQAVDRLHNSFDISKLAMEMSLDFTEKVAAAKGRIGLSQVISTCCEYIGVHLHDEIDLQQLSGLVRLGPKTLSKKFKAETGLTVSDYIHKERIKEAQALLEYSDYSISEIGYYLQYGSQSYFSSIFKKFSGVTPQQFREQLRKAKLF